MTRVLKRCVTIIFFWALAVDGVMVGAVILARREVRVAQTDFARRAGTDPAPVLVGFARDGRPLDVKNGSAGLAVRFAANGCRYCKDDEEWRRLAAKLLERGVGILVLLPSAADEFPTVDVVPNAAGQAAYLNIEWLKRYPLNLTPTVLIFDAGRRLIWSRHGRLNEGDAESALDAIAAKHRGR